MTSHRVFVTCPPMLGMLDAFIGSAMELGLELVPADVTQTLSEAELIELLPQFDGSIIGDDPATQQVFKAARSGSVKAAVKWGIGVGNVDFKACEALGIPIINTPGMFGGEVADVAVGYVIALARHTVEIDRGVRSGTWPKPSGLSLAGRTVAVVGYGDIGRNTARRLLAADMRVIAYDPYVEGSSLEDGVSLATWPEWIQEADFVAVSCALTPFSHYLLDAEAFAVMKSGARVVNAGRCPVIDEEAMYNY